MMAPMRRVAFVVTGRVQGVAFRANAAEQARRLGLSGFVRNRADGAVEGDAQGPRDAVQAFVVWLQRGPSLARVDDLDVQDLEVEPRDARFDVRR